MAACVVVVATTLPAGAVPEGFRTDVIARLAFPTGMQFTPSGDALFVNEREGRIRIIRDGTLQEAPFARVETTVEGEGGLLGLALHPRFDEGEAWVYVFYTLPDGDTDRVERFRARGDASIERDVVIDDLPSGAPYHHGGILAFGPDGKLYVTNGEAHRAGRAQDPAVLGGKIYRVDPDGSIPDDNPFRGSMTWSYGHRNPFGLAFDPETGNLWSSENGPQDHDEVNRIVRGGNYGWPVVRGDADRRGFRDPAVDYERIVVPTMMTFSEDAFPARYRGDLFVGMYQQQTIRRLRLTASRRGVRSDTVFHRPGDGVVGMTWGPDGLYFSTTDAVRRIRPERAPASRSPSEGPIASPVPPHEPAQGDGFPEWAIALLAVAGSALAGFGSRAVMRRRATRS